MAVLLPETDARTAGRIFIEMVRRGF